ncbi:MAG: extracellular solute-binding protein [Rhizobiaceae bacterium]|nr:extracellular solute-binding protein [Rhizobiaceae bacterium]
MWFSPFTRRQFLKASAATTFASLVPHVSLASNPTGQKLHGLSAFGDLKYPADFTHFDDAALDAPKGGTFAFMPGNWAFNQNIQTFNTLNSFVLRGDAPPRMELCYDALMAASLDEPDSLYCALAKSVEISEDRNRYTFELRPEARFHDGSELTAADVTFSYTILKAQGHPTFGQTLRDMVEAKAISKYVFELVFNGNQSDRAILSSVGVPILSKAYHQDRPIDASTLEVPLSSGPWKLSRFEPGKFVEYGRVDDYWGKGLPVAKGFNHFDTLRIEFFRDRVAPFEAFKKGDIFWRQEFTSKVWATEYNFPAVEDGRVVKREFSSELVPTMQGWAINSRREKFADPRTREAIALCFDFEWTNKNQFYGAYTRSASIFETSGFKAAGAPSPKELALLEPFRDQLPESVFGEPLIPYVTNGSGSDRKALRKAIGLLKAAGWERKGGKQVNAAGEPLTLEFLIRSPVFERVLGNYVENLKKVGIESSIRLVDPSQFQARLDEYDFDIVGMAARFGASPTAESLRFFLHSESADINGTRNFPAIKSPVIDALIAKMNTVSDRNELTTILRAIDRVLRPMHLWIPNWHAANHRVAYWDMFGFKEPKPDYAFSPETTWWFDEEKAKAVGKA